ncbi:MAG: hypothetical protein J6K32_08325 [Clostridia bacterium]|nr:hypothetical protein [Clostridia bacterium]
MMNMLIFLRHIPLWKKFIADPPRAAKPLPHRYSMALLNGYTHHEIISHPLHHNQAYTHFYRSYYRRREPLPPLTRAQQQKTGCLAAACGITVISGSAS